MKKFKNLALICIMFVFSFVLQTQVFAGGQSNKDFIIRVILYDGNSGNQIEPTAVWTGDIQAGNDNKHVAQPYVAENIFNGGFYYDWLYYFTESETSTWTVGTQITVSNIQVPVGYKDDEASGEHTYTVTQADIDYINSTDPDDQDYANEKTIEVYASDPTVTKMITEDNCSVNTDGVGHILKVGEKAYPTEVEVIRNGRKLSTDYYTVSYSNNTAPGEGKVIITGKNGYSGTAYGRFPIKMNANSSNTKITTTTTGFVFDKKNHVPTITKIVVNGETLSRSDYILAENAYQWGNSWTEIAFYGPNDFTGYEKSAIGSYKYYVVILSEKYVGFFPIEYKIVASLNELTTTQKPTTQKPTTTTKAVKVTAPKKATVASIKPKKKSSRKITIVTKKISKVKGYQVQISKAKSFTKKTILATKTAKTSSITVVSNSIKNKKKLYVRTRAYVLKGKTKLFGKWSVVKTAKITK